LRSICRKLHLAIDLIQAIRSINRSAHAAPMTAFNPSARLIH
jgi:hypothetical protein